MGVEKKMIQAMKNFFMRSNVKKENAVPVIKCNAARVYTGIFSYGPNNLTCCDDLGESCYKVLSGAVTAKRLSPFFLNHCWIDEVETGKFETFVLYPITEVAEVLVAGKKTERITLYKYKGIGKSIMYKQRL